MVLPWVVYGQTALPTGAIVTNPVPNILGLRGEAAALPYTVPAGFDLVLTGWGIEGNWTPFSNLFVWLGAPPVDAAKALPSVGSGEGGFAVTGLHFQVPTGKIVNVSLINNAQPLTNMPSVTSQNDVTHGWFVQGYLTPVCYGA